MYRTRHPAPFADIAFCPPLLFFRHLSLIILLLAALGFLPFSKRAFLLPLRSSNSRFVFEITGNPVLSTVLRPRFHPPSQDFKFRRHRCRPINRWSGRRTTTDGRRPRKETTMRLRRAFSGLGTSLRRPSIPMSSPSSPSSALWTATRCTGPGATRSSSSGASTMPRLRRMPSRAPG